MSKVAIRIRAHKKWADIENAIRHGRREDPARHVDRTRTPLNMHWALNENGVGLRRVSEGADIRDCLTRLGEAQGAKWRKNATVGTEMVWIASPEFFDAHGGRGTQGWVEAAKKWAQDCLVETGKRYPGMTAAARLDLDEKTPHLSIFLLPVTEKPAQGPRKGSVEAKARDLLDTPAGASQGALEAAQAVMEAAEAKRTRRARRVTVSHGAIFGTRTQLSDLQTWAAEAMQRRGHDLERGEPKATKGVDHTTPAEGRARIKAAQDEARKIVAAAEAEAARIVEAGQNEGSKFKQALEALTAALKEIAPAGIVDAVHVRYSMKIGAARPAPSRPSGGPGM